MNEIERDTAGNAVAQPAPVRDGRPAVHSDGSKSYSIGLILMIIGSTTFSGKAIIVKLGFRCGVDAVTLLMLRMLFALPFFLMFAWWAGRNQPSLTKHDWLAILSMGFTGFYLASVLDFIGLAYISASLERLILCLQPTIVLALGWLLYRRAVLRGHLVGIALGYLGFFVVFGQEIFNKENTQVLLGASLVFLSAVSYSVYLLISGEIVKRLGAMRLVGLATSVACILSIAHYLALWPTNKIFAIPSGVLWLSLLNATLCTVIPVLAVMMAIQRIGPLPASQISNDRPDPHHHAGRRDPR